MEILDLKNNYLNPYEHGGLVNIGILGLGIDTILILLLILILNLFFIKKFYYEDVFFYKRYIFLFSYHNLIFIFMFLNLLFRPNDIDSYYQGGIIFDYDGYPQPGFKDLGSFTMAYLYRTFYYFFKLDFYSISFLFSCFGFWFLVLLDKIILKKRKFSLNHKKINFQYFIIFFPSLSLWNSFLGKEVLTLGILLLFAYIYIRNTKLTPLFLILFTITLYFIRPHVAYIFFLSFVIVYILNFKNAYLKYFIFIAMFLIALPVGAFLIQADGSPIEIIKSFFATAEWQRGHFKRSSGYVDTKDMNILFIYLNFLFNPVLDLTNFRNIILSFENISLVILIAYFMWKNKNDYYFHNYFFLIFFIIGSFVLSLYTSDVGVYWRQKWLLLPYLLIFLSNPKIVKNY